MGHKPNEIETVKLLNNQIVKSMYEENLEENIDDLLIRMRKFSYKPKPSKRVYIPKPESHEKRPLGIPCYEDKLVQLAMNRVITTIYEQDFLDFSYGFRPNRNCHDALKELDIYLSKSNGRDSRINR